MQLTPYLFFEGRCEEALQFYQRALGAKVTMLMRQKESPVPPPPGHNVPGDKVMHCEVQIGDVRFMASDGFASGKPAFKGFSLSLTLPDSRKVDETCKALADQGKVDLAPGQTFWAERFAMLTDRFGVQWMLTTPPQAPARH